jgi:MoaA/NifB/PqqE/SkfB family radical SAM enzyme
MVYDNLQRINNENKIKEEFEKGIERVTTLPCHFSLELVKGCISKCIMCNSHKLKVEFADFYFVKKTIERISPYCRYLTFSGAGEPLMYPKIKEIVKLLKEYDIGPVICTNAILLDNDISGVLVDIPNTQVRISLDGACRATYKKIRGVDCFDKVMKNTKQLLEIKSSRNSDLKVIINYVVMRNNINEIIPLMELFKGYDIFRFDFNRLRLSIIKYVLRQNFFNFRLLYQRCEAFTEKYNKYILKVREYANENNIKIDSLLL